MADQGPIRPVLTSFRLSPLYKSRQQESASWSALSSPSKSRVVTPQKTAGMTPSPSRGSRIFSAKFTHVHNALFESHDSDTALQKDSDQQRSTRSPHPRADRSALDTSIEPCQTLLETVRKLQNALCRETELRTKLQLRLTGAHDTINRLKNQALGELRTEEDQCRSRIATQRKRLAEVEACLRTAQKQLYDRQLLLHATDTGTSEPDPVVRQLLLHTLDPNDPHTDTHIPPAAVAGEDSWEQYTRPSFHSPGSSGEAELDTTPSVPAAAPAARRAAWAQLYSRRHLTSSRHLDVPCEPKELMSPPELASPRRDQQQGGAMVGAGGQARVRDSNNINFWFCGGVGGSQDTAAGVAVEGASSPEVAALRSRLERLRRASPGGAAAASGAPADTDPTDPHGPDALRTGPLGRKVKRILYTSERLLTASKRLAHAAADGELPHPSPLGPGCGPVYTWTNPLCVDHGGSGGDCGVEDDDYPMCEGGFSTASATAGVVSEADVDHRLLSRLLTQLTAKVALRSSVQPLRPPMRHAASSPGCGVMLRSVAGGGAGDPQSPLPAALWPPLQPAADDAAHTDSTTSEPRNRNNKHNTDDNMSDALSRDTTPDADQDEGCSEDDLNLSFDDSLSPTAAIMSAMQSRVTPCVRLRERYGTQGSVTVAGPAPTPLELQRVFTENGQSALAVLDAIQLWAEGSISQLRTQMMFDVGGADQLRQIDAQYEEHVTGSGSKPGHRSTGSMSHLPAPPPTRTSYSNVSSMPGGVRRRLATSMSGAPLSARSRSPLGPRLAEQPSSHNMAVQAQLPAAAATAEQAASCSVAVQAQLPDAANAVGEQAVAAAAVHSVGVQCLPAVCAAEVQTAAVDVASAAVQVQLRPAMCEAAVQTAAVAAPGACDMAVQTEAVAVAVAAVRPSCDVGLQCELPLSSRTAAEAAAQCGLAAVPAATQDGCSQTAQAVLVSTASGSCALPAAVSTASQTAAPDHTDTAVNTAVASSHGAGTQTDAQLELPPAAALAVAGTQTDEATAAPSSSAAASIQPAAAAGSAGRSTAAPAAVATSRFQLPLVHAAASSAATTDATTNSPTAREVAATSPDHRRAASFSAAPVFVVPTSLTSQKSLSPGSVRGSGGAGVVSRADADAPESLCSLAAQMAAAADLADQPAAALRGPAAWDLAGSMPVSGGPAVKAAGGSAAAAAVQQSAAGAHTHALGSRAGLAVTAVSLAALTAQAAADGVTGPTQLPAAQQQLHREKAAAAGVSSAAAAADAAAAATGPQPAQQQEGKAPAAGAGQPKAPGSAKKAAGAAGPKAAAGPQTPDSKRCSPLTSPLSSRTKGPVGYAARAAMRAAAAKSTAQNLLHALNSLDIDDNTADDNNSNVQLAADTAAGTAGVGGTAAGLSPAVAACHAAGIDISAGGFTTAADSGIQGHTGLAALPGARGMLATITALLASPTATEASARTSMDSVQAVTRTSVAAGPAAGEPPAVPNGGGNGFGGGVGGGASGGLAAEASLASMVERGPDGRVPRAAAATAAAGEPAAVGAHEPAYEFSLNTGLMCESDEEGSVTLDVNASWDPPGARGPPTFRDISAFPDLSASNDTSYAHPHPGEVTARGIVTAEPGFSQGGSTEQLATGRGSLSGSHGSSNGPTTFPPQPLSIPEAYSSAGATADDASVWAELASELAAAAPPSPIGLARKRTVSRSGHGVGSSGRVSPLTDGRLSPTSAAAPWSPVSHVTHAESAHGGVAGSRGHSVTVIHRGSGSGHPGTPGGPGVGVAYNCSTPVGAGVAAAWTPRESRLSASGAATHPAAFPLPTSVGASPAPTPGRAWTPIPHSPPSPKGCMFRGLFSRRKKRTPFD